MLTIDAPVASQQTTVPLAPSVQSLADVRNGIGLGIDAQHPRSTLRDGINLAIDRTDGTTVILPFHPNNGGFVVVGILHRWDGDGGHFVGFRINLENGIGMASQPINHAVVRTLDSAQPLVVAGKDRSDEPQLVGLGIEGQHLGEVARDEVEMSPLAGAFSSQELILAVQEGGMD